MRTLKDLARGLLQPPRARPSEPGPLCRGCVWASPPSSERCGHPHARVCSVQLSRTMHPPDTSFGWGGGGGDGATARGSQQAQGVPLTGRGPAGRLPHLAGTPHGGGARGPAPPALRSSQKLGEGTSRLGANRLVNRGGVLHVGVRRAPGNRRPCKPSLGIQPGL